MRPRWMMLLTVAAVGALIALPAGADETELDSADRALVHSYDPAAMQLLWATVSGDAEAAAEACDITEGDSYTYEVDDEGNVTVTPDEEGADPTEPDDCTFTATDVTGPEGQVNHGTVVSSFVQALQEEGIEGGLGCYARVIAQSDYGKGDQQVKVGDVDEGTDEIVEEDSSVEFTITETTCGKPEGVGEGKPEGVGKPDDAGKPEGVGKPDDAGKPEGVGDGKPDWAGNPGPPEHAGGGGGRP